jgi:hypothetical protein
MRTREEMAWAAGFFEGEGNFSRKGLAVAQVNREPLDRLKEITGFGTIRGPYRNRGPIFLWEINSFELIQAFVAMVWPWLSERRREQARKALARYHALPSWSGASRRWWNRSPNRGVA